MIHKKRTCIAVIGAGIAGITAAYRLAQLPDCDVTLIEKNSHIGGHTNTITVEDPQQPGLQVDTGFIVCNPRTYPNFYQLLDEWNVGLRDSDMSFGYYSDDINFGYVGPGLSDFLKKWTNLFSLRFLKIVQEQRRFNQAAIRDLKNATLGSCSLGEYLDSIKLSNTFVNHYLVPMAAAIWSSPDADMLDFPAETFIRFFANHGLLDLRNRPTWQTIVGGSQQYLRAFREHYAGKTMLDSPVSSVTRSTRGIHIDLCNHLTMQCDHVILATHANISLRLLKDASLAETSALSAWQYQTNHVQLHTDASVMPRDKRLWASWNYHRHPHATGCSPLTMTYYMNRLQGLTTDIDYFVTLNAAELVDPKQVIYAVDYDHPVYSLESPDAQQMLRDINGELNTHYCGSYMRYGFHEDAVVSAMNAVDALKAAL